MPPLDSPRTDFEAVFHAIGIIQAERRCGPEDAFQLLVNVSQRTNMKVRSIAAALVSLAETAPPGPLLPGEPR
ncbi:ANTAR domain-containing protein [Streptomyces xinghaiensis]|uniref:ANTAR domain-containing protein n=1 Tax=Streptomyces xinghaiensis TaxID=1038928 RepID=UPI0012FF7BE4|nr:ANTAR domain-containing protein [Streptomyces xinghaiensis]MZE75488.1 ANTAR domain-containing protein [Streptomyces sp. SID5475]